MTCVTCLCLDHDFTTEVYETFDSFLNIDILDSPLFFPLTWPDMADYDQAQSLSLYAFIVPHQPLDMLESIETPLLCLQTLNTFHVMSPPLCPVSVTTGNHVYRFKTRYRLR